MTQARDNHFIPQWHQRGFLSGQNDKLFYLKNRKIELPSGSIKSVVSKKKFNPAQCFYEKDLYSTFFGSVVNDDVEKKLFGPIDNDGSEAVRAFLTNDQEKWHTHFKEFFTYLDAQKLRTPKGLDWIKSKYPNLSQIELMIEMQALRNMHCLCWAEGVRELVSAKSSNTKFILSDHPVTIYNFACPPSSESSLYPNDPDISLKGSQTLFPLDKNKCLILTNLEYALNPNDIDPLEQRSNPTRVRESMVNTINFINKRELNEEEVSKINLILKQRAKCSVAAGNEDWLYPERHVNCDWADLRDVLLPPANELHHFGGEIVVGYKDGSSRYQDAFGRTTKQNELLKKHTVESKLGRNELCGCGSNKKYKECCKNVPKELRTSWVELSIRERNLALCRAIKVILGLNSGKTWQDVQRNISTDQIKEIYQFHSILWPKDTGIYSLLPKSDGKFRALYTGIVDVREVGKLALPLASVFDELLIECPIVNSNNVNRDFSPVESPAKFRYQALKDFSLMLELEPYIGYGLINLFPGPNNFDSNLMQSAMKLSENRQREQISELDRTTVLKLDISDYLNSIHMASSKTKIRSLVSEFGVSEEFATKSVKNLEENTEPSPLVLLQTLDEGYFDQLILFNMIPNYELALFTAQVTGSIIVTDRETRWKELQKAQNKDLGITNHPWSRIYRYLSRIPIDYDMVKSFQKSQKHHATTRVLLKNIDKIVRDDNTCPRVLEYAENEALRLKIELESIDGDIESRQVNSNCKVLAPKGGMYDNNVQRLLVRSSCTNYDSAVRAVYYVSYH